jgi:hypothetical protein
MYPFEVFDERTQRVEFYFNRFGEFKNELFRQYPVDINHSRLELELLFPSERLEDVYCHDWNPHERFQETAHLDKRHCFYNNSNWSTIFELYPMHSHHTESYKCFVEEGHQDPWGEKITLMSTAASIHENHSFRFAFFRQKYWKVIGVLSHNRPLPFTRDFYELFRILPPRPVPDIRRAILRNPILDRTVDEIWDDIWDGGPYNVTKKIDAHWQKEGF